MKSILSRVIIFSAAIIVGSGLFLPNNLTAKNKFILQMDHLTIV